MSIFLSQANGFYGSKGISGRIPEAYTLFERRFMSAVRAAQKEWAHESSEVITGVQLHEWEREGWTYHAKGQPYPNDARSALTHLTFRFFYLFVSKFVVRSCAALCLPTRFK